MQRRLWTHDYSPQAVENIGLVPQYFALALTDLVVETAYGGVGAGTGPDLGQHVELAPNVFGLRCDFDLRFRGAVGHPWESALSCISLNRGPSGLGKTRTGLDRDAGASRTTWVSVWANRARNRLRRAGKKGEREQLIERGDSVRAGHQLRRGARLVPPDVDGSHADAGWPDHVRAPCVSNEHRIDGIETDAT